MTELRLLTQQLIGYKVQKIENCWYRAKQNNEQIRKLSKQLKNALKAALVILFAIINELIRKVLALPPHTVQANETYTKSQPIVHFVGIDHIYSTSYCYILKSPIIFLFLS